MVHKGRTSRNTFAAKRAFKASDKWRQLCKKRQSWRERNERSRARWGRKQDNVTNETQTDGQADAQVRSIRERTDEGEAAGLVRLGAQRRRFKHARLSHRNVQHEQNTRKCISLHSTLSALLKADGIPGGAQ
jgi:hypothetical protein